MQGRVGSLKLPRRAGAGPGPGATHLWIPSGSFAQNPGKLPTPGTSTMPAPPPRRPPRHGPKIQGPGHQLYPPRTWLLRVQTPEKTEVASSSLAPQYTYFSLHQLHWKNPKESSSKTLTEVWGRAGARVIRRAELGGAGEVGWAGREKAL